VREREREREREMREELEILSSRCDLAWVLFIQREGELTFIFQEVTHPCLFTERKRKGKGKGSQKVIGWLAALCYTHSSSQN